MSEDFKNIEKRRKYFDDVELAVGPFRQRAFDYESKAIDFANNALRVLTYLNGGALVATPTAVALFQTDLNKAKFQLIIASILFVSSLVFVVLAHAAGFFTMARRAESTTAKEYEQVIYLVATHFPESDAAKPEGLGSARDFNAKAAQSNSNSNWWRAFGLICVWVSLGLFIGGCVFGSRALLGF